MRSPVRYAIGIEANLPRQVSMEQDYAHPRANSERSYGPQGTFRRSMKDCSQGLEIGKQGHGESTIRGVDHR